MLPINFNSNYIEKIKFLRVKTMFIRVKAVKEKQGAIFIYAWSLDGSVAYKFHHCPDGKNIEENSFPRSTDDDSYVTFRSPTDIQKWLVAVKNSKFSDPTHYHLCWHNCAMAGIDAFNAAGIDLLPNKKYKIWNLIRFPFAELRLPFCTLTPSDVLELAKNRKLQELESSKSDARYQATQCTVKLWIESTSLKDEAKIVAKIKEEIDERHKKCPENTEEHIELLMQTYRLVTLISSETECHNYLKSAEQFKKRKKTKDAKLSDRLLALQWISIILLVGIGLDFLRYSFSERSTLGGLPGLALLGTSLFTVFATERKMLPLQDATTHTIEPTELSEKMGELVRLRQRATV